MNSPLFTNRSPCLSFMSRLPGSTRKSSSSAPWKCYTKSPLILVTLTAEPNSDHPNFLM